VLKIDEVSNLGAVRIRIRSLLAALKDKADEEAEQELLARHSKGCPVGEMNIDWDAIDAKLDAKTGKREAEEAAKLVEQT
jgi:hypothetical protein